MFGLLRSLLTLAMLGVFVFVAATVPLGERTLFQHVQNIWGSDEAQELVEGVKKESAPVVKRVNRAIEAAADEPEAPDGIAPELPTPNGTQSEQPEPSSADSGAGSTLRRTIREEVRRELRDEAKRAAEPPARNQGS